ncbi:hypothetical protein D3C85_1195240 [compost metagenome]
MCFKALTNDFMHIPDDNESTRINGVDELAHPPCFVSIDDTVYDFFGVTGVSSSSRKERYSAIQRFGDGFS